MRRAASAARSSARGGVALVPPSRAASTFHAPRIGGTLSRPWMPRPGVVNRRSMARVLPGTGLRVRRGRRADLPQLAAVLGPGGEGLERVLRRLLADLGRDVYVAEEPGGEIVGLVSVVYARSLVRGGLGA